MSCARFPFCHPAKNVTALASKILNIKLKLKVQSKVPRRSCYLVVAVDTWVEQVGSVVDTAAAGSPVARTAAVGKADVGKMAEGHTVAAVGTVAVEDKHEAVDKRLPEEEDKRAEAGENRTVLDTASDHESAVHILSCTVAAVLRLHNRTNRTSG